MSEIGEFRVLIDKEVATLDPALCAEMAAALLRGLEPDANRDAENSLEGPVSRLFEGELSGIRRVDSLHQLPSQFRFDGRGVEVTT
jgi:hypothetical protein